MSSQDVMFKVLVVGNAGVGKTCILKRLIYKSFSEAYKSTIGVDFGFYKAQIDEVTSARMMLYDIAGQERYNVLMRSYYKDAFCAFVVGDLQSPILRDDLRSWKSSIDSKVTFPGTTETIPCYMLCNKCDLPHEYKDEELEQICQQLGFQKWFKTSALTGEHLEQATVDLAKLVVKMIGEKGVGKQKDEDVINLVDEDDRQNNGQSGNKKQGCC
ncbi:Rab32 [Hexamita inflata]|uniref:Putative n=1 Tax=Hexamita inflata TaxID=28002 RepID=A0AA86P0I6_9EUKA|nr:Rab32 [Hexamita inflata]